MSSGIPPHRYDIKIPVADLKIGMFVAGLDRNWLETPFLMQGFFVRSVEDIEAVQRYCQYVYVIETGLRTFSESVDLDSPGLIGRAPQQYPVRSSVFEEHKVVKNTNKKARSYVKNMLDSVRLGEALDSKTARDLVKDSVDSIIRNPDAQALMTKLRGQDEYTAEHCLNVCILSIVFGRRLGLKRQQLINLGYCGLFHDVGKINIPDEILNKPGRLTPEEFEIMKQHTVFGRDFLLQQKGILQDAIEVAYTHHERPDGSGYPRGILEKDLSMFAKIISIVDAYDAITGDRVYAAGKPSTEALRIIYEDRGRQFDREFALAFIQTIGIYPPGTIVELVNGCVGIVIDTINSPKYLPNLLLVRDEEKKPCQEQRVALVDTIDNRLDKGFFIKTPLADGCYGIALKDYYDRGYFEENGAGILDLL